MNKSKPIVSVIIPAYNVEKYIERAVEDIKRQTETRWEIIIADDCSTDRTREIALRLSGEDERIKVIGTPYQSGGAYVPRKMAISAASADIVAPLDADDSVGPRYLENLLSGLYENPATDIVYPVMHRMEGAESGEAYYHESSLYGKILPGREMLRYTLDGWRIHCNGGVIRRVLYMSVFEMIDEWGIEVRSYIDEYLSRLLIYNARGVMIIPERYDYLDNPASITHSVDIRAFGLLWNNSLLLPFVKSRYDEDSEERILMERQNFHTYFDALKLLDKAELSKEDRRRVMKKLKDSLRASDRRILKSCASRKLYYLSYLPGWLLRPILRFKKQ